MSDPIEVTRRAAGWMGDLFDHLVARGEDRERARRFTLQCVAAMFAEGIGLVPGFGGGLFEASEPIALAPDELTLLASARALDWAKVEPPIFGELFQQSLGARRRHALGAHFTRPTEIHRVVTPTIVAPWRRRIAGSQERDGAAFDPARR